MKTAKRPRKSKLANVRPLPEAADLEEAVLVGDEVDIFLHNHLNNGTPKESDLSGVVDRRSRNFLWIRDSENPYEEPQKIQWNDEGKWAFVRVVRGKDSVLYVNGNPFDSEGQAIQRAKGLGLILEPQRPASFESVFRIMRGETPDLDQSAGQAPKSFEVIAPSAKTHPVLRQVREVMRDNNLEPDMVDDVGNGRVMILTQDSSLKSQIRSLLTKSGVEVKATRTGALIARKRSRKAVSPIPSVNPVPTLPAPGQSEEVGQPTFQVNMPSPEDAMQRMEDAAGVPAQETPEGVVFEFDDPEQMQQFVQKAPAAPTARRRQSLSRKKRVIRVAGVLRGALRKGNLDLASRSFVALRGMGVKVSSLSGAGLTNGETWRQLSTYMENQGNVRSSRTAARLSRMVGVG